MRARRRVLGQAAAGSLAFAFGFAGCRTSPPTRWYALPTAWDELAASHAAAEAVWELSPRIALPGALDRDTVQVARDRTGFEPLAGHRWAEPLRDALPRVLLHDLRRLRGDDRVWPAPAPPGVAPARRLHVELQALHGEAEGRTLHCQARWWCVPLDTTGPPRTRVARFAVDRGGDSVDALVVAHRRALWQLAQRIVAGSG